MPIKPADRARYPRDWRALSQSIRLRANNQCEWCRAPNGMVIARGEDKDEGTYMLEDGQVFDAENGDRLGLARGSEYSAGRFVRVVLTCSHLDHTPETDDPALLAALCQRCHLRFDARQHAESRRRTREERSGQVGLFEKARLA